MTVLQQQGALARKASRVLAASGTKLKNAVLEAIAEQLICRKTEILRANARDLADAKEAGLRRRSSTALP
jgi:glutamate-5-semialdehyde dehydrogenase